MALTEATPRSRNVIAIGTKFKVTLAGTVIAGDLIGYASGWKRALATTGTAIVSRFVALQGGVSGDVIEVACEAVVSGFSGGSPGGAVYNEEGAGVGGGYTESAPATGGDVNVILGYILSASEVHLLLGARADSTG
jgi:hypothetical protein